MPYDAFGAQTDHFELESEDLILQSSTKTAMSKSQATAQDEQGDVVASTWYGARANEYEVECEYVLKSGTLDTSNLKLGDQGSGKVILSIEIKTSNGSWPTLTVSGRIGTLCSSGKTYTLPSVSIAGQKKAQAIGFSVGEGCKLVSSSISASCDYASVANGEGEVVAADVAGAQGEIGAELVAVTAAPSWTVSLSGAVETQKPGITEPQAEYHTASAKAAFIIQRDPTP